MSLAFVFPGQGSQAIGMMGELASQYASVKDLFIEASDALGTDLWTMTQSGPIEELSKTEHTQPALLTAGVAAWQVWQEKGGETPSMMAGHSLGEYTALVSAGAIDFVDAVLLVRDRGRFMQGAVPDGQGAMAAIIGLDDEVVREVCAKVAEGDVLQAVNFNAPGQVVIAGSAAAIDRASAAMKEAGAKRALPLPVSIPAHSRLMTPAAAQLADRIAGVTIRKPTIPVLHNCNVSIAASAEEVGRNLITQLDSPVRWVESIKKMRDDGVATFIESGPGKVLSGMIKRIDRSNTVACIDTPNAIEAVIQS